MESKLGRWLTQRVQAGRQLEKRGREQHGSHSSPRRNGLACSPFALLPYEVLINIIEQIASQRPPSKRMHIHIPRAASREVTEYRYKPWSVDDEDVVNSRYALLTLSQTCRHFRHLVKPMLWSTVNVQTISQLEFYTTLLARTPNARHVYGQHVRHLCWTAPKQQADHYERDWLDDDAETRSEPRYFRFQRAIDFRLRDTNRQVAANITACYSLQSLKDTMCLFFTHFRDLRSLRYSTYCVPLEERMRDIFEAANGNERLQSFELRSDTEILDVYGSEQGQHCVPNLTRSSITHLNLQLHMGVYFNVHDEEHGIHADRTAPFGLRIEESVRSAAIYTSLPDMLWVLHTCWLAAQHGLQSVVLPLNQTLYAHKLLQRLWLCLEVLPLEWNNITDAHCIECEALVQGLAIVRAAVRQSLGDGIEASWWRRVRSSVMRRCPLFAQWNQVKISDPMRFIWAAIESGGSRPFGSPLDPELKQTLLDTLLPTVINGILTNVESDGDLQHVLVQYHAIRL